MVTIKLSVALISTTLLTLSGAQGATQERALGSSLGSSGIRGNRKLEAQTCTGGLPGIENTKKGTCCPLGCKNGQCGGRDCGKNGLPDFTKDDCCNSNILASEVYCDTPGAAAPCIIGRAQTCTGGLPGIENTKKGTCCALGCSKNGQCGGRDCGKNGLPDFTKDDCCNSNILASEVYCDTPGAVAPCIIGSGACHPNPCLNGGTCGIDPAGGHQCTCSGEDYRGMHCQIETAGLAEFYIEVQFEGTWTTERAAVFQLAADRWSEVISHVPCGGSSNYPAGRNLITATLETIDGQGSIVGYAGPSARWRSCPTISAAGAMTFDIDDIAQLESSNTFVEVILHEMGHAIGVGTLWELDGYSCTTCGDDGNTEWTCLALIEEYNDLAGNPIGTEAYVVEGEGGIGTACDHLDENIFGTELMTGYISSAGNPLSKLTAASLEDIGYIVNPAFVDPYELPGARRLLEEDGFRMGDEFELHLKHVVIETTVDLLGEAGVVGQAPGIIIETFI